MELTDFTNSIPDFVRLSQPEQVKLFGWFILFHQTKERFTTSEVRHCFESLHMQVPNVTDVLNKLEARKPKVVLKDSRGWRLEMRVRQDMDTRYGQRDITIAVEKSLSQLPNRIADETKRKYLEEALKCLRATAYRAAIVMTWNLAYDHLLNWLLADPARLAKCNAQLPHKPPFYTGKPPVATGHVISKREEFEWLTERDVVELCGHKDVAVITDSLKKVLVQNLDRRNMSAHPATVEITQVNAEDT